MGATSTLRVGGVETMTVDSLMCRGCGQFVRAVERDESLVPLPDDCPACHCTEFKDVHSGNVIRSDGW
jgi:hypothetical protein